MINASSIADAWDKSVRHVLMKGVPIITEDGEHTLETDELIVKVKYPLDDIETLHENCPYGKATMHVYADTLIHEHYSDSDFAYTYYGRLIDWREEIITFPGEGVNQIDECIHKLKTEPKSRRSIAITWIPCDDMYSKYPPCLQWIQFLIRDNKLQMKVLFRSNDILMAMYANIYALVHLQKYVADSLDVDVGSYTHMVTVPHIYFKRDANEVEKWK